jgi:pimeloyl-ACP methyl ester carboxylesterase
MLDLPAKLPQGCVDGPAGLLQTIRPGGAQVMVARRHVFYLAGFDPIDGAAQQRRFRRESAKYAGIWNLKVDVADIDTAARSAPEMPVDSWQVETRGPNWQTQTKVELLDWQDIVRDEIARPAIVQVPKGLITFCDFVFSGTAKRYFELFWPYGLFFLTPYFHVFANIAISMTLAILALGYVANSALSALTFFVVFLVSFAILFRWPGDRFHVRRALADWNFARDFMYWRRPEMDARLDQFAARIVAAAQANDCDEILIVGHSLGAQMSMVVLARAMERDPELYRHGPRICLLTLGSTIGKLALHPAAVYLRACAERLGAADGLAWSEFQARRDSISFFRLDPVSLKKFKGDQTGERPFIRLIGIKDMMMPDTYRKNWFRHMRLHYQFVMGNEKRSLYDFFMFVCGPADFVLLSRTGNGAEDLFATDGSFHPEQARLLP